MLKRLLYISFVILLIIPTVQWKYQFVNMPPLNGSFELNPKPYFSINAFKEGKYQSMLDNHLTDSIGFRNYLLRLNNQINYSFFNEINSSGVIQGENDMLIPKTYIESYLGLDFLGVDQLALLSDKIKIAQDYLAAEGIHFMLMIAPGKASIFPENIPDKFLKKKSDNDNYTILTKSLNESGVNYLDLRKYLNTLKGKTESQVFPNHSVHWSGNTVTYIADTLTNYIAKKFNLRMPIIYRDNGYYTLNEYRYTDYDIGESMNLLFHVAEDSLYYPTLKFYATPQQKPTLLACGDSFFQSLKGFYPILDSCFSNKSKFYYYNEFVDWPWKYYNQELEVLMLDIGIELSKTNIVILEMTDENIKKRGYGFIDDIIAHYENKNIYNSNKLNELKQNPDVLKWAKKYHQLAGYTMDEMTHSIAVGIMGKKYISNEDYERLVNQKVEEIKQVPEWFEKVKRQAIEKNIPLEQNLRENAEWVVNESLKN